MQSDPIPEGDLARTFTATARRAQIVACAIEAIAELGYARASLAEVGKRAGISKGVISYHFTGKDELVNEVVAEIFSTIEAFVGPRLQAASSAADFVLRYIEAWVDYYRVYRGHMLAVADIWTNLRTDSGRQLLGTATIEPELASVEQVLRLGQQSGELRSFDPRVMAISIKAALDGLLGQLVTHPDLDLDGYARELVALFDHATRAVPAQTAH